MMRPYTLFALASSFELLNAAAEEPRTYQLDPFAPATEHYASCPAAKPPVLTDQEMRVQCVRSATQKKVLERLVKRQPDVAIVWNETTAGANLQGRKNRSPG